MEKLLSIAIPCYNVEWCLEKCLCSFLAEPVIEDLEVIIVNDGSTDGTRAIAEKYVDKRPASYRLINKDNGGHGSAINKAINLATGKYFTAVDADDWVITENLDKFLGVLANTDADAIITHYHTVDMASGCRNEKKTRDIPFGRLYTPDEFVSYGRGAFECAVYHGLTYKTLTYKESAAKLTEGVFYEDHEYATLPFTKVRTILPLDLFLYQYLIGNSGQSVAEDKQIRQLGHLETVIRRLFECHRENPGVSEGARRYIARKATDLLVSYYIIAMIKNPDKRGGREAASQLRREMQNIGPTLVSDTDRRYKIAVAMSRLGFSTKTLGAFKRIVPYGLFRKWYIKE